MFLWNVIKLNFAQLKMNFLQQEVPDLKTDLNH